MQSSDEVFAGQAAIAVLYQALNLRIPWVGGGTIAKQSK